LKKSSEYREHARDCRLLARTALTAEHRLMLENMARTWDLLAEEREDRLRRQQRLAELEQGTGHSRQN
jgi:hypothetical protein